MKIVRSRSNSKYHCNKFNTRDTNESRCERRSNVTDAADHRGEADEGVSVSRWIQLGCKQVHRRKHHRDEQLAQKKEHQTDRLQICKWKASKVHWQMLRLCERKKWDITSLPLEIKANAKLHPALMIKPEARVHFLPSMGRVSSALTKPGISTAQV